MNDNPADEGFAPRRQFASDNYSGVCPEAWAALEAANRGHATAYGDDAWTARAAEIFRELFETDCEVFFAFNGTAANAMSIAHLCRPYHGVLCHEAVHLETDECGAPEFFSGGAKTLPVGGADGKISPEAITREIESRRGDVHFSKPGALSLTQSTELGTVYTVDELGTLGEIARRYDLRVHMDGARFANALAALGVSAAESTWKAGVDVLSFGGTKNGLPIGEVVVFFDKDLAHEFDYRRKQSGQLASKMRFLAAPWIAMIESGAWLRRAGDANRMAARLCEKVGALPGIEIPHPCEVNAVFARMPEGVADALRERGWKFYPFHGGTERLMCSWDTTEEDVDAFAADIADVLNR